MSTYKAALELAKKGFHVFPLNPNSKTPAIKDFPRVASRDPERIKKWWFDPVLEIERPYNVGISTSHFADKDHLVVIDVDNKGDKKGDDELLGLELEGLDVPDTFEQLTPTGGRHLVYRTARILKQGVRVFGGGLDIRARGGYIVGAGSSLEGKLYTSIDRDIKDAPRWLDERLSSGDRSKISTESNPESGRTDTKVDRVRAEGRAKFYLENEAPLAVEGQGGDQTTFAVAARVKDFGVEIGQCLRYMLLYWNPRCSPPWEPVDLQQKIDHAYKYGVNPEGVSSPEADFSAIPLTDEVSFLDRMNKTYALVYVEGGHFILEETVDEKGQQKRVFMPEATFKRKFSPFTVQSGRGKPQSYAEIWLDWDGRREYAGVCFAPEREPGNNYYNLWRGFTCTPIRPEDATPEQWKGFQMFIEHAKDNVCHGDDELFQWLMGYFAHMIQKPYERPLTTLVFKGSKGTGKNALVDRVGKLLGAGHYLVAQDGRYLTSNFNGHMDSCLMLVLDEAFWSGDKAAEGKLKGITTSPEIMVERKGKEPYVVDNLVRLVVIGNEEWLVPASADERRYAVFQMGEGRRQDRKFFEMMRILLDDKGGKGVLLHYFKTFDLSKVEVNAAPKTEALYDQKLSSMDSFNSWWIECLTEGRITHADFADKWETQMDKENFRNAYRRYIKDRNIKGGWLPTDNMLGKKLKACLPSVVVNQKRRDHERTVYVYRFPELDQARKEWEAYIGHEVNWL